MEKLRKNEELTAKDRQIHDDLDAAVADAYGWAPLSESKGRPDLPDDQILQRLVALNAERAEEEKRGLIRWLRPDFQNPAGAAEPQATLALPTVEAPTKTKRAAKAAWPKSLSEQAQAIRAALAADTSPTTAADLARRFRGANSKRIAELLATLTALGQARSVGDERFVA